MYPNVYVGGQHPLDLAHNLAMEETCPEGSFLPESDLPKSFYARKLELYEKFKIQTDAFYTAARVYNDGVILPTDTRRVIAHCLDIFDQDKKFKTHLEQISVLQPLIRM